MELLPSKKQQQNQEQPQSAEGTYTRSRYSQYDNRRDSMFGNHSARSSIASDPTEEGSVRRKKSFDANGKVPRTRPVEKGCVAKICNIFGKSSNTSDYDYRPMK